MKFIKVIMLVFFIFYSSTLAISGEQVDLGQRKLLNAVQLGNIEVIKNAIGSGINLLTKNTLLFSHQILIKEKL